MIANIISFLICYDETIWADNFTAPSQTGRLKWLWGHHLIDTEISKPSQLMNSIKVSL